MNDEETRHLQRAASQGDPQAEAQLLMEQHRRGELPEDRLRLSAFCGHKVARELLKLNPLEPFALYPDLGNWSAKLCETHGAAALYRGLLAVAWVGLELFEHGAPAEVRARECLIKTADAFLTAEANHQLKREHRPPKDFADSSLVQTLWKVLPETARFGLYLVLEPLHVLEQGWQVWFSSSLSEGGTVDPAYDWAQACEQCGLGLEEAREIICAAITSWGLLGNDPVKQFVRRSKQEDSIAALRLRWLVSELPADEVRYLQAWGTGPKRKNLGLAALAGHEAAREVLRGAEPIGPASWSPPKVESWEHVALVRIFSASARSGLAKGFISAQLQGEVEALLHLAESWAVEPGELGRIRLVQEKAVELYDEFDQARYDWKQFSAVGLPKKEPWKTVLKVLIAARCAGRFAKLSFGRRSKIMSLGGRLLQEPSVQAELVPWALGYGDPLADRTEPHPVAHLGDL